MSIAEPATTLDPAAADSTAAEHPAAAGAASAPGSGWEGVERRSGHDRRDDQGFLATLKHRRRRNSGRRATDLQTGYVDAYTRTDFALLLTIFVLNIADAFFTLHWLGRGGKEGNPLMQHLLDIGTDVFLFQKIGVAAFWLLLLTVHKNFRVARIGMWVLLAVYGCLFGYHLVLFFFGEPIVYDPYS